jgi:hypothetical protein
VARALERRRIVVLFFGQRRSAEDAVTSSGVRALRRRRVAVFTDSVERLPVYARVVGGLGVSQAPATVIIDRGREARLLEGFQDAGSLRQYVRDATR